MTTLRGIFPEPKAPPRRNFVLENKRDVRKVEQTKSVDSKESISAAALKKAMPKQTISTKTTDKIIKPKPKIPNKVKLPSDPEIFTRDVSITDSTIKSFRSFAVQTVKDTTHFAKTDYIIMATPSIKLNTNRMRKTTFFKSSTLTPTRTITNNERPIPNKGTSISSSSANDDDEHSMNNAGYLDKMSGDKSVGPSKDLDMRNAVDKLLSSRSNEKSDKSEKSPEKKTNKLPRYLQDKKKSAIPPPLNDEEDLNCPEGHVALPDSERKETLGVLRKRFAELVAELNKLPVRTDTLRIRKRKMDLEQELCKLEEGINVFSRHRVYVKVNV